MLVIEVPQGVMVGSLAGGQPDKRQIVLAGVFQLAGRRDPQGKAGQPHAQQQFRGIARRAQGVGLPLDLQRRPDLVRQLLDQHGDEAHRMRRRDPLIDGRGQQIGALTAKGALRHAHLRTNKRWGDRVLP